MRAQDMQDFAQNNVKNASTFINKNETSEPWVCDARYSITYRDAKYLCILCEYSYGMGTTSRSKRLQGDCFLLETGNQCRLNDFLLDGVKADTVFGMVADATIEKMVDSYGRNRLNSDMTRDKLIEIKKESPNDFYITDTGITFFYQLASIAPFSEGVLEFSFTADEMKDLMKLPMTQK